MNIVIFGTGQYYENRKNDLRDFNIVAFIDNKKELQGEKKDRIEILAPKDIEKVEYDCIVLMSADAANMKKQLLEYGVSEDKIYYFGELKFLRQQVEIHYFYNRVNRYANVSSKKVLLLTHELSLTGAPYVVYQYARLLQQNGFNPIVASMRDGKLRDTLLHYNIPVLICANLSKYNPLIWEWMQGVDIIIANTIAFYYLMNQAYGTDMKIIWWIHDIVDKRKAINMYPVNRVSENIMVYAGGRLVKERLDENYGFKETEIMLYGVLDRRPTNYNSFLMVNKKLVFAIVASIQYRKGQDIFVNALLSLSTEIREQAEFLIIGKIPSKFVQDYEDEIRDKLQEVNGVKFLGEVENEDLYKYYENKIDVIICPSRYDPMPIAVTDGLMFEKVCIISDSTGQADFINDKENGLVFETENVQELAGKIKWVIQNKGKLRDMGSKAREVYEKIFSMNKFSEMALKIVNDRLR